MSDDEFNELAPISEHAGMPLPLTVTEGAITAQSRGQLIHGTAGVTTEQAKVNAIADLTHAAYARASTLQLTPEEQKALQDDFPDEAFKPGAAGKENLIYIEHAFLRDRFNQVFGPGQWSMIPRSRWAEDFTTDKGKPASRVYVEAMLLVRGCFVSESVGDMVYWKNNDSQNYGDAVEGAKTAAFRRCAKELGVGLQAWKKDWCEGWWTRKRGAGRTETPRQGVGRAQGVSTDPPKAQSAPQPVAQAPAATTSAAATPGYRTRMIQRLHAGIGEPGRDLVTNYFRGAGMLMPNEAIEDLDLCWVPISEAEMGLLGARLAEYERGDGAEKPFPAHDLPAKKAVEVPRQPDLATPEAAEEWRSWPCPFGKHAGVPLEDLDPKYLYGFWKGFTVETEYNGRPKKPETIAKDTKFREMLDAAGVSRGYK